jgi:hypothetical protein
MIAFSPKHRYMLARQDTKVSLNDGLEIQRFDTSNSAKRILVLHGGVAVETPQIDSILFIILDRASIANWMES